ncbi:hypothetical protein ACEPAF_5305 [Sanghuangporus sanghuang]
MSSPLTLLTTTIASSSFSGLRCFVVFQRADAFFTPTSALTHARNLSYLGRASFRARSTGAPPPRLSYRSSPVPVTLIAPTWTWIHPRVTRTAALTISRLTARRPKKLRVKGRNNSRLYKFVLTNNFLAPVVA